ncbi:MAG TPA: phosphoribosyl transferase, partial [Gammaproteobacteria bacterium]
QLRREVDEVVALDTPEFYLGAVGAYYDDFAQVTDEEVITLLQSL